MRKKLKVKRVSKCGSQAALREFVNSKLQHHSSPWSCACCALSYKKHTALAQGTVHKAKPRHGVAWCYTHLQHFFPECSMWWQRRVHNRVCVGGGAQLRAQRLFSITLRGWLRWLRLYGCMLICCYAVGQLHIWPRHTLAPGPWALTVPDLLEVWVRAGSWHTCKQLRRK